MRPEDVRICVACNEVYRAAKGNVCPVCKSVNTMPVPAVLRTSEFFQEAKGL